MIGYLTLSNPTPELQFPFDDLYDLSLSVPELSSRQATAVALPCSSLTVSLSASPAALAYQLHNSTSPSSA